MPTTQPAIVDMIINYYRLNAEFWSSCTWTQHDDNSGTIAKGEISLHFTAKELFMIISYDYKELTGRICI